ncbi:MAG: hypothetical protein DRP00_00795 [Candidatus Aenigmatarchaeota archaeon]|nr:MAG: hypothetical protein DRP00_00795 [Candidatus Aenigmarchaeota archaeon]
MNEKKGFEALTYALFKSLNEFKNALEAYEAGKVEETLEEGVLWNQISGTLSEVVSKYNLSPDSFIDLLFPPQYKPLAKVIKKMRIDQVIDLVAEVAKEYAKDEDGNYRSLEETLTRVAGRRMLRKIFGG